MCRGMMNWRTGIVAIATLGVVAGLAQAQGVEFDASFSGQVNGKPVSGQGGGTLDVGQQGGSNGTVDFSSIPDDFDPLSVSLLSNLCSASFRTAQGTDNLWTLGGDYSVQRVFQWVGFQDSFITIDSEVVRGESSVSAVSTIAGKYTGPVGITGIKSYSVIWLPGSLPGEIFESGTMVLSLPDDGELIVTFASIYRGLDRSIDGVQVGIGLIDASFDGTRLTFGWDGQFAVPAPGAMGLLSLIALAATRRRRA